MFNAQLSLKNPAVFLATLGGIGWLPKAPGTWASLITLPLSFFIISLYGLLGLAVFCFIIFFVGVWACSFYSSLTKTHDSGDCVIDECLGQSLVILFTPIDPMLYAIAFVYFRFFDIFKPWPTKWFDQNVKGGLGVMLDDVVAAVQASIVMALTIEVLNVF
ncbi:MAG: phosphatidylglycerophosphatase A [Rhodospirillaceae bacterium]|jgi:phosphatidylglycerophosphatase A|nr:phosphatidylglycerophosphatase A [Rhodospirillaceae bacterium]